MPNEPAENQMFPNQEQTKVEETITPPAEFVPDTTKTQEENDAAKLAFDAEKKTTDEKAAADKAEADKKAAEGQPLTKEAIKLPEGFEADDASMTKFLEILNNKELAPGDRANALVNLQAEVAKSWSEKATAQWDDFNKTQVTEVEKDPELGGAKLPQTLAAISDLINTYGDADVRKVMDDSGAGNNLAMVRFLHKIAGVVGEGKPTAGAPSSQPRTQAETMFPSMAKG